jgi:DNA adenine methylase
MSKKYPVFFSYIGGKHYLLKHLLKLIPEHKIYVEAFCGSAKLLFAKNPSKIEVINDYDKRIANLFYVVAFKFDEFFNKAQYLVYSRALFEEFKKQLKQKSIDQLGDVDDAVMTYGAINIGFAGEIFGSFGYAYKRNSATAFSNKIQKLPLIHERLKNVTIESLDFEAILDKYGDKEDAFIYLDPPYYKAEHYYNGFNHNDHERLLNKLPTLKAKWLLSGYANKLYDNKLKNFYRLEIDVKKHSYGVTKMSKLKEKPNATEVLWANYNINKIEINGENNE